MYGSFWHQTFSVSFLMIYAAMFPLWLIK